MVYQINYEAYACNFSLPAAVVGEGMAELEGDYLKVVLLIFKNADRNYSVNLLSNLLNLPEARVEEAIRYWIGRGVLLPRDRDSRPVKAEPVLLAGERAEPCPAPPAGSVKNPSSGELTFLVECMENQLHRPVTPVEYKSVIHILEYIRLPADVVLMAIEYCISVDKMNARYLEKLCADWADRGITSHEAAEEYLSRLKQERNNEAQIKRLFGIENRNLIESEKKCVSRWLEEFRFGPEVIGFAYERMIGTIGKLSFPYINKILQSWHEKGYRTLEEIRGGEGNGPRREGARSTSYNIAELDEYWKNNVPKF